MTAVSIEVKTKVTVVPAAIVMLLSFGPGPIVFVAGVGTVPLARFEASAKASTPGPPKSGTITRFAIVLEELLSVVLVVEPVVDGLVVELELVFPVTVTVVVLPRPPPRVDI